MRDHNMNPDTIAADASTPCLDPVDKLHQLDYAQRPTTNTAADASPEDAVTKRSSLPPLSTTTTSGSGVSCPTPSLSKREHCTNESTSPTKVQSPLRHSVSYTDPPELPFPFASPTGTTDPTKSPTDAGSRMALTGDRRRGPRPSWLSGTGDSGHASSETTPTRLRTPARPSAGESFPNAKASSPSPSSGSRFGFLTSSMSALKGFTSTPATSPRPVDDSDDLISLNVEHTLNSLTSPTDRSAFSPAAFKNLQMIATGMLHKFQDAYTQRTMEVRELQAERAEQADEQGESEMKMQHLRMQLEGMAQRAAEHEEIMQSLMAELTREKKLRMEERSHMEHRGPISGGSSVSEDLSVEEDQQRKKWRKSDGTSRSDTSYDTDEEGIEEASVFSRSRSPTIATTVSDMSPVDAPTLSPPTATASPKAGPLTAPLPISKSPHTQAQMTTFQKLFKGISGDATKEGEAVGPRSCTNCQGQHSSVAWDTVSLLKGENKGLKERVGELEGAMECALDAVNGVGF